MAKHPHKLLLINRKTWKCTLDGCSFFVHLGLQDILIGKHAVCWNCDETFIIDATSLRKDKPICSDCRMSFGSPSRAVPESVNEPESKPTNGRTPEQQKAYEREMKEMFGPNWRSLLRDS